MRAPAFFVLGKCRHLSPFVEDVVGSQCLPLSWKTEMREARIRKAVLQQLIIIRSSSHLHACFCIATANALMSSCTKANEAQ